MKLLGYIAFVLLALNHPALLAAEPSYGMMDGTMMQGMGWTGMILCLLFGLLLLAVLVLAVMSLLKYLREPRR